MTATERYPAIERTPATLDRLKQIVGPQGWSMDPAQLRTCSTDWNGRFFADALLVLKPSTTAEVSQIVSLCNEAGLKIVPQGGNTSLAAGAVPTAEGNEIVLNLARMNRIREIDTYNDTISVDAGCVLAAVQHAAQMSARLFPLRLASEGSCQIGGNIASNAGGTNVLRYGNMRDLVLSLEVVLPNGTVIDGMRGLRKDNTGYDLKQLFIGSEGTLGIITGAVLKLFPEPCSRGTAICTVSSLQSALDLLVLCKRKGSEALTAFELMPRSGLELVFKHFPATRFPLDALHDWQVLIEFSSNHSDDRIQEEFQSVLEEALEAGLVVDAAIARSIQQNRDFWSLREGLAEADFLEGALISGDISVPLSAIPAFIEQCSQAVLEVVPTGRVVAFGHVGDGNIHFGLLQPTGWSAEEFLRHKAAVQSIIHEKALSLNGSTSAEHGLGYLHNETVSKYRSHAEHDLMRMMKTMLDPNGTLNPGKVLKTI
jgi:FAD/FMN-containing dehydrogenase